MEGDHHPLGHLAMPDAMLSTPMHHPAYPLDVPPPQVLGNVQENGFIEPSANLTGLDDNRPDLISEAPPPLAMAESALSHVNSLSNNGMVDNVPNNQEMTMITKKEEQEEEEDMMDEATTQEGDEASQAVSKEEPPPSPDITTHLETDNVELTAGNDIITEANHIFKIKQGRKLSQVVSMAFKVTKKDMENGKPRRVKVIITSKETIEAAMLAAEQGNAEEAIAKLKTKPSSTPITRKRKREPVRRLPKKEEDPDQQQEDDDAGSVPPWTILEQVQRAWDEIEQNELFGDEGAGGVDDDTGEGGGSSLLTA